MNMNHEMEEMAGHHHNHHQGLEEPVTPGMDSMGMDMGMKMYFHFGLGDLLLLPGLRIDTNLKLCLASLALFGLALLLEWLHYLRSLRCQCELNSKAFVRESANVGANRGLPDEPTGNVKVANAGCCSPNSNCETGQGSRCSFGRFRHLNKSYRLLQTFLQCLRTVLAFTLMLAAMTYNLCLIFAIVLGTTVGFYVFYRPFNEFEQFCH